MERLLRTAFKNARNAVIWDLNWEIQDVMTKDCDWCCDGMMEEESRRDDLGIASR